MPSDRPTPITRTELAARERRVARIARRLGFVGKVGYRHASSRSGGAQYVPAANPDDDLLIVFAEAFDRDSNATDFSLESIIAHERGHQLLAHHPRLLRSVPRPLTGASEEILASLIGSLLVKERDNQQTLVSKAMFDLNRFGVELDRIETVVSELRKLLEKIL
jgi:hypothetical protein